MSDTPTDIQQMYSDFIMSKSVTERFRMGFDMSNEGRRMIEWSVTRQHPDWSTGQLKAAVFERMYRDDFTADEMKRITAFFLDF